MAWEALKARGPVVVEGESSVRSADAVLVTERLTGGYGGPPVLRDVSLEVPRGAVFGLMGANGSGKTTLLRMTLGLLAPSCGKVRLFGKQIGDRIPAELRARIGTLIEGPSLYEHLSGAQNIQIAGTLKGIPQAGIEKAISQLSFGRTAARVTARSYSRGMRQWLAIIIATMGNPDFVLLDEPLNGLDAERIWMFQALVGESNETYGTTYLIVSHHFSALEKIVNYVGVLGSSGHLLYSGRRDRLTDLMPAELLIGVRDVRRALELITETGVGVKHSGSFLVISAASEELAEDLNRRLSAADVGVRHLSLSSTDLEALVHRMLTEADPWKQ